MAQQHAARPSADGARRLDVQPLLHGERGPPHHPREVRRLHAGDGENDRRHARAHEHRERDGEQDRRKGEHEVDGDGHRAVYAAAEVAAEHPSVEPSSAAPSAALTPTVKAIRAPYTTRLNTSRPYSSVPNQ